MINGDTTVEFYLFIRGLIGITGTKNILDFGAGRAEWLSDKNHERVQLRSLFKDPKLSVTATDVSTAVLNNEACNDYYLIDDILSSNQKYDIIICDYVFEHVSDPKSFSAQLKTLSKENTIIVARTPHRYHISSLFTRFAPRAIHKFALKLTQSDRADEDVFDTYYRLNTEKQIARAFQSFGTTSVRKIIGANPYRNKNFIIDFILRMSYAILPRSLKVTLLTVTVVSK